MEKVNDKLTNMKPSRVIISVIAVVVVLAAVIIPASMHIGASNAEEGAYLSCGNDGSSYGCAAVHRRYC